MTADPDGPFDVDQTLDQFLLSAGGLLESLGIPYMVTGSFASSVHGEPRMTLDADLVITRRTAGRSPDSFAPCRTEISTSRRRPPRRPSAPGGCSTPSATSPSTSWT